MQHTCAFIPGCLCIGPEPSECVVCELLPSSAFVQRDATLQLPPATSCMSDPHNLCAPGQHPRRPLQSAPLPVHCVHTSCLMSPVQELCPTDTGSSPPEQPRRGSQWAAERIGWQLAAAPQLAGEAAAWDSQTPAGEPQIIRIGPHDFCGEEALIDGPVQRVSTVTALTDCELATISKVQPFGPALHGHSTCVV